MSRILVAALVAGTLVTGTAYATPIRLDFSGRVRLLVDMTTGMSVPSAIGTKFSGFLTYDVANPEYYESRLNEYGQPIALAINDSGCGQLTNGVCVLEHDSNPPLIIDYGLHYAETDYAPLPANLGFSDASQRSNQSSGGSPSGERWQANRNQFQIVLTGDPVGDYIVALTQRVIQITADTSKDDLLDYPASNLTQGFNLDAAVPEISEFRFFNYMPLPTACTYPNDCDSQYAAGSFDLNGTLEKAEFHVVPEATTLTLLGLGLAGLSFSRRRSAS